MLLFFKRLCGCDSDFQFPCYVHQRERERVISGSFYKSCLLIQSHTVLHFLKDLKNFKFWSNKAAFGYFRNILRLEFTKINIKF